MKTLKLVWRLCVVSFPGLPRLQFLVASDQKLEPGWPGNETRVSVGGRMFRVGYVISNVDKVLHIGQQKTQVVVKTKRASPLGYFQNRILMFLNLVYQCQVCYCFSTPGMSTTWVLKGFDMHSLADSQVQTVIQSLYSAKFSWVFNFANFQSFAKIFQRKILTLGMQCVCAVNLRNYFTKIASRENLNPWKFSTILVLGI